MVRTWNYPKRRYARTFAATKRRRYAYKKRKAVRKLAVARPSLDVHVYKRWGNSLAYNFTVASGTSMQNVYIAQFDKIVNYTEFTTLYDQYEILKVVMKVRLLNNPDSATLPGIGTGINPTNIYPRFWYCPDYDDETAETWTVLRERAKTRCKILEPNKMITVAFKPAVLNQLYRTSVTTGYAPKWNQRIDCDQPNVPHYGMKWSIEIGGFQPIESYPYSFQFDFIYYFKMYDSR